jgi:hypothetical protein
MTGEHLLWCREHLIVGRRDAAVRHNRPAKAEHLRQGVEEEYGTRFDS